MLRSLKNLEHYTASATDGDVGNVVDFLLEDDRWVVRYLVVHSGSLLMGRRVLLSPISFRKADWVTQRFHVALTIEAIKNSPGVDMDKPVSRQHEQDFYQYYGYPYYWGYGGLWGMGATPELLATDWSPQRLAERSDDANADVHLRSAKEVRGYHIQGIDKAIGHIDDFILDDEPWAVRYLVVDTSNWWIGKKVLLSPHWATRVSWSERKVYVDLSRLEIQDSPEWNPLAPVNREDETRLYDYYGRPAYWVPGEPAGQARPLTAPHLTP